MTDGTRTRIANEIRHERALLTVEETWWQQQPASDARTEGFRRINFWRNVLRDADKRLGIESDDETHARPRPTAVLA